jgi:adenosylcobinamide-phosphate synthase
MTEILLTAILAVVLDRLLPDRRGIKPFAWYRDWAESIEERFNGGKRLHGVGAVLIAIVPIAAGVLLVRFVLGEIGWLLRFVFDVVVLYLCLDVYRLSAVAGQVSHALESGNQREAEEHLRALTGKGAPEPNDTAIARTTVEAVLKQGNSLVISPLFWFLVLGPVGAVVQRLSAILDMLWGHRYERFAQFGWAAARFDDVLGWIPARITALSYALMGNFEDALHAWRARMGVWSDINSGPLLASGYGALHMQSYEVSSLDSEYEDRSAEPVVILPDASHIRRVVALVWRVLLLWLAIGVLMAGAHLAGLFGA